MSMFKITNQITVGGLLNTNSRAKLQLTVWDKMQVAKLNI